MKRVIIESPYAGNIALHTKYAQDCCLDSIRRGEAPFASHLLYPQMLDDSLPADRELGIQLGYEHWYGARLICFYLDHGWSQGMKAAHERAVHTGKDIELRYLPQRSGK